ncbi:MAG: DUF512 domain-containing protein [Clostridia bacterium]|nr:DUF512 domain-containing protein [Clostridia bacterium]
MVTIVSVERGSLAEKADIRAGDILISVNGNDIADVLDYRFYLIDRTLSLLLHRGPDLLTVEIKKGEYDDIGLEFETYLMDKKQTCRNKCIFCFIDQLPRGMRETLYFKDDDSRLSFLMGNYITLTNMSDRDIDRIIRMHMSPINISVQTTNPELRCKMLHNRFAGDSLRHLRRLAEAGIAINAQIVLCKGVNDEAELERSLTDLASLGEAIQSVAIVPAGLTKYRDGLFPLSPFTKEEAAKVIDQINRHGDRSLETRGERLFYAADEFYLQAELPLPSPDYYEGYPQLDNGVGMITCMDEEFSSAMEYLAEDYDTTLVRSFTIATGRAAYDFISKITTTLCDACPGLSGRVYQIENRFFGPEITVAGLICGCDLYDQLKDKPLGERLYISSTMLRDGGDLFLDDLSLEELSEKLGIPIIPVEPDGDAFIRALLCE